MASPPASWMSAIVRPSVRYGWIRPLDEQGEQVSAEGRHLLADDDLDGQAPVARDGAPGERGVDPLVVGDGDDIEIIAGRDVLDDRDHVGDTVRRDGVDMEVGATGTVRHCSRPCHPPPRPRSARSGQIGKNTAHHCSGASAMTRSKARAIDAVVAVARSRRDPSVATSTGSTRPM